MFGNIKIGLRKGEICAVECFGSHGRVFVLRSSEILMLDQCIISTIKHDGGSVMFLGCSYGEAIKDLIKIRRITKNYLMCNVTASRR